MDVLVRATGETVAVWETEEGVMGTQIVTGTSSRAWYAEGGCFCGQMATRVGRCEYHAGMWDARTAFVGGLGPWALNEAKYHDDFETGYLCLQHILFCEGFPEYADF